MSARDRRKILVVSVLFGVGVATLLAMSAFEENFLYYINPSEVVEGKAPQDRSFRMGGLVVIDSVKHSGDSLLVKFTLTDNVASVPVEYSGILPDLFREGQGIIAIGKLEGKVFVAQEVLAKHDENYMPPEVAESLQPVQSNNNQ